MLKILQDQNNGESADNLGPYEDPETKHPDNENKEKIEKTPAAEDVEEKKYPDFLE